MLHIFIQLIRVSRKIRINIIIHYCVKDAIEGRLLEFFDVLKTKLDVHLDLCDIYECVHKVLQKWDVNVNVNETLVSVTVRKGNFQKLVRELVHMSQDSDEPNSINGCVYKKFCIDLLLKVVESLSI